MSSPDESAKPDEYVDAVLAVIAAIPAGRVMSYGAIAEVVGRAGPRQVGRVLALHGSDVPWWRVVHADGAPATCHDGTATDHLVAEGVAFRPNGKVDLAVLRRS